MCVHPGIILFHTVHLIIPKERFLRSGMRGILQEPDIFGVPETLLNCECNILCGNCNNLHSVILWKHPARK